MRSLLRAASPRRRSRREQPRPPQSSESPTLRLNTYEYIPGGGELALVRLVAKLGGVSADEIELRGAGGDRHRPLPATRTEEPSDSGLWRAAFSVPLASVESGQLALVLGGSGEVPLPPPVRRSLGIEDGPDAGPAAESDRVAHDEGAHDAQSDARRSGPDTATEERPGEAAAEEQPAPDGVKPHQEVDGRAGGADVQERLDQALAAVDDANAKREELVLRCQHAETQVAELRQRLQSLATEAQRERESAERHEHDAELLRQEVARARDTATATAQNEDPGLSADLEAAERRVAEYVDRLATAVEVEQKLRARIESLESAQRPLAVPASGQDAERDQLEATIAELRARVAELERQQQTDDTTAEPAGGDAQLDELRHALDAQRVVEDDLRAMLASSKRQAEDARREVAALRDRLADSPRPAGRRGVNPAEPGWSALDQDLIERLTKAKELSGSE